jgi:hypothetical protein
MWRSYLKGPEAEMLKKINKDDLFSPSSALGLMLRHPATNFDRPGLC